MIKNITSEFLPLLSPTNIVSGRNRNTPFSINLYTFLYLIFLLFLFFNQLLFAQSDGIKKTIEKYKKNFFIWNEPEKENPNADTVLTVLGRWAWGPCNAVDAKGDYAYIGNGPTFQILDISIPITPQLTGEYLTEGYIYDLEVRDNTVFVCIGGGVLILDVSNPSLPQEISFIEIGGVAIALAVEGSYVYVTTISGYMRVVDITEPSNPYLRGFVSDVGRFSTGIEAKDGYVYIGNTEFPYLIVVNATDPDNLFKSYFDIEGKGTCAFIKDSLLFLGVSWFTTQLKVYSISNLSLPSFIGQVEIADSIFMDAVTVSEDGFTAYALCLTTISNTFPKGVYSIDISDLTTPLIADNFEKGSQIGVQGIAVVQNTLLTAYFSGVCILDITSPNALQFESFFPTGGFASKLQVKENVAYIASGLAGLWILDISNPESPLAISNIQTSGNTCDVVVEDSLAYIVNWPLYENDDSTRGLWIINIADINNPELICHYFGIVAHSTNVISNSITKSGDLLMITQAIAANSNDIMETVDVSNPYAPVSLGIFQGNYLAHNTAVNDSIVYLSTFDGGLRILNISNPNNPYEISNILNSSSAVFYANSKVYTCLSSFSIIDVENPFYPFIISSIFSHSNASIVDLDIDGDYAYWADWSLGVIDISNLEEPIQLTTFDGKDRGLGVAAVEDKIFFSDQSQGVWLLKNNLVTSVENNNEEIIPEEFELYQNYPNPFNPITNIEFAVPFREKITIDIYDLLGRKINTLLNEEKEFGKYKIEFNSYGLASGVYFYKLTAGDVTKVKKMLIIR